MQEIIHITKRIDELGRVVIPADILRALKWRKGDELEMIPTSEGLILRRVAQIQDGRTWTWRDNNAPQIR